jgi:hypothetical protein
MNPYTNKFEFLTPVLDPKLGKQLLRPNGEPVPEHWMVFRQGELVVLKNYTFKVAYMNEGTLVLEPAGTVLVGSAREDADEK